jgi:uncharacterized protein (TIGR02284 family)
MILSDDRALTLLRSLTAVCRDSQKGYETAAKDAVDPELGRMFVEQAKHRAKLLADLEQRVRELRGDPNAGPTVLGAIHRSWMDYRAADAPNQPEALLTEIERGEALAVETYRMALKEHDIDAVTRRLIEHQYELVHAAHDRMKQLRDRAVQARTP